MFIKEGKANRLHLTILDSLEILSVQEVRQEMLGVEVDKEIIGVFCRIGIIFKWFIGQGKVEQVSIGLILLVMDIFG